MRGNNENEYHIPKIDGEEKWWIYDRKRLPLSAVQISDFEFRTSMQYFKISKLSMKILGRRLEI